VTSAIQFLIIGLTSGVAAGCFVIGGGFGAARRLGWMA
jgi:hypothetical protein